jgi:N-acetylglucosaminyldiphosphoundecaprenol N-acetyl-beta-D-mannosaminyltransferase
MNRLTFLGVPVDLLSLEETVGKAEAAMAGGRPMRHVALNVAKLVNLRSDADLARDVGQSDIVGIDGMGIVWALKLFGVRSASRVAGIDLMFALMAHCARTGRRPYVLGARQDVLDTALDEARARFPGLKFAGSRNGYYSAAEEEGIVAAIRDSRADCLFVAMPSPRKERFLARHGDALGVPFVMGVGGSIDVLAGHISRAPAWMQASGLEWFHRLAKEPRRMAGRYLRTNSLFFMILLSEWVRGRKPVRTH